jgi:hypothetical protein
MLSEGLQRHNDVYYHITNVQYLIETHSAEETLENRYETVNKMFEFIVAQVEDRLGYTFRKKPLTSAAHKENGEPSDGLLQSVADADMKIRMAQIPQAMPNELIAVPKTHQWQVIRNMIKPPLSPGESDVDARVNDDTSASGHSTFGFQTILQMATVYFASGKILLNDDEILLSLQHKCGHPPRQRKPVARSVRDFIKSPENACRSPSEMYKRLYDAAKAGTLGNLILSILQTVMFVIGCCSHRRTTTWGSRSMGFCGSIPP